MAVSDGDNRPLIGRAGMLAGALARRVQPSLLRRPAIDRQVLRPMAHRAISRLPSLLRPVMRVTALGARRAAVMLLRRIPDMAASVAGDASDDVGLARGRAAAPPLVRRIALPHGAGGPGGEADAAPARRM
ncbi:MAG: hypothetical protein KGS47_14195, partial [Chloroflexi bacterium]|nr:hypothetical protein [Chloroflexota bacterium]